MGNAWNKTPEISDQPSLPTHGTAAVAGRASCSTLPAKLGRGSGLGVLTAPLIRRARFFPIDLKPRRWGRCPALSANRGSRAALLAMGGPTRIQTSRRGSIVLPLCQHTGGSVLRRKMCSPTLIQVARCCHEGW
jgi:hypothetical protein